ncbi:hypothetical protein AB1Y20_004611 [Prymnesium parvum]|uniref:HORMA domain-containing protein n=1 Tax=Prymnesium parvum TaxID=97485 RepID=A0AB34IX71_PRYPA|mmetsp:Transcript_16932/g.35704  ORF Transcript_16932/g.35704 Transcript_16932/m.35704 type:complete len:201 (-) Transcript_16932:38-640(-)
MAATASKTAITLKGSVEIVSEFFGYSINSILYQRGIYPPETFKRINKYGLAMLVTADEGLQTYLNSILAQLTEWLTHGTVQKLVLVVAGQDSGETLERWVFDVQTDKSIGENVKVDKPEKEIMSEIQAIIRQITASVTFLPLLEEACTFDMLVYTDDDVQVPKAWEESDPRYIANSDEVRLRSFTTKIHRVDASVSYKAD